MVTLTGYCIGNPVLNFLAGCPPTSKKLWSDIGPGTKKQQYHIYQAAVVFFHTSVPVRRDSAITKHR